MAVTWTSLASQLYGPKSISVSPNFSDLRYTCNKINYFNSQSQSLFHHVHSNLHLSSSGKASCVIIMAAASGKEELPSALDMFEEMMSTVKGKEIVVFLDYDGTLSPIVDKPDEAYMSDDMRAAVLKVAKHFHTAIISGRRKEKVKEFVNLSEVYYAGSHGMDISVPKHSSKSEEQKHETMTVDDEGKQVAHFHPPDELFLPTITEIIKAIQENVLIEGSEIEDNKYCISVHYRRVKNEEEVGVLKEMVESIMKAYPNFGISGGKKVIEIRPNIDWDKGRAVEYLLTTLGFNQTKKKSFENVMPVYIGDDRTDEDAFKFIRDDIGQGFPIVVSSEAKKTMASYSLRHPDDVMSFLERLANWGKANKKEKLVINANSN